MKKLRILAVLLCMMLGLTLTSCVGAAAMVDETGVSVDILVAEGVPYYDLDNVLLYYYWNGRYWYRYWYHNTWYYRPYVRPMPGYRRPHFTGPQSGDVWRHGPRRIGPRHYMHRPNVHRPNPPRPKQPDRMSPQPRPDRGGINRTPSVRPSGGMNRGGGAPSVSRGGGGRPSGGFGGPRSGSGHAGGRR